MITLTISRLNTKSITTSRGDASIHNFKSGSVWYSAFVGSWNEDWQDGTVLELDEKRIVRNQKNGKTYLNIVPPPKSGGRSKRSAEFEQRVLKALEVLWRDMQEIKKALKIGG